jgi:predicted ATPase
MMTHEGLQTQLLRFLQNKQLLLVMDNFEHLLDGVQIESEILPKAPGVKILATSREKLNLISETIFILGGMGISLTAKSPAEPENDASALFIQSAHKISPGFEPGSRVCRLVFSSPY